MYDELVKRLRAYAGLEWHFRHISKQAYEMIKEAADAIKELEELSRRQEVELVKLTEELASKPRWIPVTERLPEMNTLCLLYNKYYGPMVGARIDEMRFRIPGSRFPDTPTHWMPLPKAPEEE